MDNKHKLYHLTLHLALGEVFLLNVVQFRHAIVRRHGCKYEIDLLFPDIMEPRDPPRPLQRHYLFVCVCDLASPLLRSVGRGSGTRERGSAGMTINDKTTIRFIV